MSQSPAYVGDDRLSHVVPFISSKLSEHKEHSVGDAAAPPLMIGLNGVQGCGKSTLVEKLQQTLSGEDFYLDIVVFSIDDLYLTHEEQTALAQSQSDNPLVQHRGQPSTHDVGLGKHILDSLRRRESVDIPIYDKGAFNGQGDRVRDRALRIDAEKRRIDLVILEGWQDYKHIEFINDELKKYDVLTGQLGALIHLDAEDIHFVYDWRLEAERKLRERTGSGMTDEQVKKFVNGYYPSYELYTEELRSGRCFPSDQRAGSQLRLVIDKNRKVKAAHKI